MTDRQERSLFHAAPILPGVPTPTLSPAETARTARAGILYGIAAYGSWGLVPLYFKAISHVPAIEVVAHRIIWSALLLAVLMGVFRRWPSVPEALRSRRTLLTLCLTTVLIGGNWFLFIWAVEHKLVLQASLGYFINPLVNVLLGFVFLRERLSRLQSVSVAFALAGVAYLTASVGQLPLVALTLATSFGFYGLLRKITPVDALVGLTIETALLAPFALAYLAYTMSTGVAAFAAVSHSTDLLLVLAGAVTALPLLWFANAARRLRLATLGFLQYLSPSCQFLLAVAVFREPFSRAHLTAFVLIWTALLLYSLEAARKLRAASQTERGP